MSNLILLILSSFFIITEAYTVIDVSNVLDDIENEINLSENDLYLLTEKLYGDDNMVDVKLYYECHCPDCKRFDKNEFGPAVEKLSRYLNIETYPYGNAQTIENNGMLKFKCQHGPAECYGNKLHACAIDYFQNTTTAVLFNICMMGYDEGLGSNDLAADRCALSMSVQSKYIKACARGERGSELLKYYGEESKKANFSYVPYILINGQLSDGTNFLRDVCAQFHVLPPPCRTYFNKYV
ncbi:unnamed protein product [Euphydryas editha]|uniref:Uncharacterized protein n=1 Tax=Euphydryas editha TaxID=104508 RepID=A0AAU9UUC8_EUPED|nr:unnamed protein product [Euphydryas editha]